MFSLFKSRDNDPKDGRDFFSHYDKFLPPGLGNPGNLCYLNSLFQMFASSEVWKSFFSRCPPTISIVKEINRILSELSEPFNGNTVVSTKLCRSQLSKAGLDVSVTKQQDFREFFCYLLEVLEGQIKQSITSPLSAFSTRRIFPSHCIYEETTICTSCNQCSSQINQTSYFILDVNQQSLSEALHNFFGPINLPASCPHCKYPQRKLSRKIIFFPQSIVFFINRAMSLDGIPLTTSFEYPSSLSLDTFSLIAHSEETPKPPLLKASLTGISEINDTPGFKLTSVVAFLGRDNHGHYVDYRVHKENYGLRMRRWVCCNDSRVTPISEQRALSQNNNCILLHYEADRDI